MHRMRNDPIFTLSYFFHTSQTDYIMRKVIRMSTPVHFYHKSSLCIPESMHRKARDRKFVCLRKEQPAPDFRGSKAPIPPLCYRALFLTHPQNAVVTFY